MSSKVILIFIDGIGLGEATETNPFYLANMPFITSLIGTKLVSGITIINDKLVVKGIDACLGINNCPPQSATGQTALLTGVNASQLLGYHLTAYPNDILIKTIQDHNIFKKVLNLGLTGTFANAYDLIRYNKKIESGNLFHSVTTHCVLSEHLPFRTIDDLKNGTAIYWDITHKFLKDYYPELELLNPLIGGKNLAGLSNDYNFVLYECFLPDLIGHNRNLNEALTFLEIFDQFLEGCYSNLDKNTTIIISSDHGNMEDLTTGGHTYNPVPLIAMGSHARNFENIDSITDVCPMIVDVLGR